MKEFIPIIAALIALASFFFTVRGQSKISRINRDFELFKIQEKNKSEKELQNHKYREPLARAAADLQSRIYNILKQDFFYCYYIQGNDRQRNYAVNNTSFLFFQFFAWTEAVRREIQFISFDDDNKTGKLSKLQNSIYSIMQADKYKPALMVFAGEQRALGEIMLKSQDGRAMCIGYGEYLTSEFKNSDPLVLALTDDVVSLAEGLQDANERLKKLQHALIDLLTFLDPECIRFPKQERSKII
ncbi:lysogenic protein [Pectobacterium carotovorum]|uniref:lysogenic protein n=1 Tax=Pectobacterium carotovorum TaxID=554 RepID=UPI002A8238B7|nr:lysogenic protein [Pectobacterium carotovorum]MDY4373155.1 lysogenic protein [Pectobacterium carotovorum subsp. carotovorum]